MRENEQKAWNILTDDEKTSLTLQIGLSKSSWEVGEIMTKSHYKYLEIKYRAEYFLKLFAEHLDLYDRLIPDIKGNKFVIAYLRKCIEDRKKPMSIIKSQEFFENKITKSGVNKLLEEQLNLWKKSDDAHENVVHDLVKEFDRWNNFRILPKIIQEPSAYKRRVKNVYKKHLKMVCNIHPLSLKKLLKLYQTNRYPFLYMPIKSEGIGKIYKIKMNQQSLSIINKIGLYLFSDIKVAEEYINSVDLYTKKGKKECTDGLIFWPKYRELIKKATNYNEVQQISPTRRHLIMALSKFELL